jgi:glycosyltransferase involved in cell wall biosynthesis
MLVTIGIPTYNRLPYLKEAVASALAQTYPNIEILVAQNPHQDRGMRDEIAKYCEGVAEKNRSVRYELHSQNLGQTGNFQWLVDNALGDYILLIGDDDHIIFNGVETLVNALSADVMVAFGRRRIIDAGGQVQPPCVPPIDFDGEFFSGWPYTQYEVPAGRLPDAELWAWRQAMGVEASLIRVSDFRRVTYRDLDIPDLEFFIFLAREPGKFVFVPEYVTEYRLHLDSSTARGFSDFRQAFDDLESVAVRPEIEPYKRTLLEVLAFRAVSKSLLAGELNEARRLLANKYYPKAVRRGSRSKGHVMKFCAALPGQCAIRTYKFLYAVKNGRKYRRATVE